MISLSNVHDEEYCYLNVIFNLKLIAKISVTYSDVLQMIQTDAREGRARHVDSMKVLCHGPFHGVAN